VEKPYSRCWLAHEGFEWRGDRDEWPETEWSFEPSRRAVAIFYVRTEGEGMERLKAIVELHLNIRAVEHLESLGYRHCGTYKITSGMKELNVKHIVEDLRRGEACYFIIESEEPFKWQVRPYEIYPVWSENLTRTSIRTPTTICESLGFRITPFRHYFIDAVLQSKPVEKPYSRCWLAHEGFEWRGDRDEWPETEWSFEPSRRAVAIFYVRTEGEGMERLKAIVELHLNIRAWGGEKP
jgi:hypothetical protein